MAHEILVDLFRNRPSLAAELLTEAIGAALPPYDEARLASIDLTETRPAEYRADVVVLLLRQGKPVRVIVVEVQLHRDDDKPFSWPAYLTVARAQHRCPAELLVVAPHAAVANWCARPIEIGPPGFVLHPFVLQRDSIPVVTDAADAARRVELAVLSAMAHGASEQGEKIASAFLPAIDGLDEDRARFYFDLVYNSLNEAARRSLEAMMKGYEYQSDFAKKYVAEGAARAVLTVLRARGVAVPDATREQILAERDRARLERWLERAVFASSLDEVLVDPS